MEGGLKEAAMARYWDGSGSADFEPEEAFAGRCYGDVLDDDAFVRAGRSSAGDDGETD